MPIVQRQAEPKSNQIIPLVQRQAEEEEEAEQIQTKPLASKITPLMQRQPEPEEEEENIQTKGALGNVPEVTPKIAANINALRGGGQPLPETTRRFFEPRFSVDFSKVRIHNGRQAAEMSQGIRAKAFTQGTNIYFNEGQYNQESLEGRRLLAHELTHVVQQGGKERIGGDKRNISTRNTKSGLTMNTNILRESEDKSELPDVKLDKIRWRNYTQSQIGRVKNLYLIALVNAAGSWSPPPKHSNVLDYFMDDLKVELAKFVLGKIPMVSDAAALVGAVQSAANKVEGKKVEETISSFKKAFKTVSSEALEKLAEPTNSFSVALKDKIIKVLSSNPAWNVSTPSRNVIDKIQQEVKDLVTEQFYGNKAANFSSISSEITKYMSKYWGYYLLATYEMTTAWWDCKRKERQKGADSDACTHYFPPRRSNVCVSWSDKKMKEICGQRWFSPMPPGWTVKRQKWLVRDIRGVGVIIEAISATGERYVPKQGFERYRKNFER